MTVGTVDAADNESLWPNSPLLPRNICRSYGPVGKQRKYVAGTGISDRKWGRQIGKGDFRSNIHINSCHYLDVCNITGAADLWIIGKGISAQCSLLWSNMWNGLQFYRSSWRPFSSKALGRHQKRGKSHTVSQRSCRSCTTPQHALMVVDNCSIALWYSTKMSNVYILCNLTYTCVSDAKLYPFVERLGLLERKVAAPV
jgi:hypothetical protein